jgi:GT2 family glycosyltransferase
MSAPAVSVVVATYNRSHLLDRLIAALESQQGPYPYEIVIVDDGSSDATPDVLRSLARRSTHDVRAIHLDTNRGPAAARNEGWRAARAPLIAFTDDDCVPQPEWLASLVRALANADIVQGRTIANPGQERHGVFAWTPEVDAVSGFFETCNIGYRRDVLDAAGGLDERFTSLGGSNHHRYVAPIWGEDADLGWRAKAAGATVAFSSEAVVLHDMKGGGLRDRLAELPRRGGTVLMVKRHPAMRELFETRWFADPAHAYLLAALAGGIAAAANPRSFVRWLAPIAPLMLWARRRGVWYEKRLWPRALPQWLLSDLVEIGVLARQSVRQRTFFL